MSLRERSIVNWIIYHLGMDTVYRATQSMTGALKGQPQTSMISHLVNVFFGYTQLEESSWEAETLSPSNTRYRGVMRSLDPEWDVSRNSWKGFAYGYLQQSKLLIQQKCQIFLDFSFSNATIYCFSLACITRNRIRLSFWLLVRQMSNLKTSLPALLLC